MWPFDRAPTSKEQAPDAARPDIAELRAIALRLDAMARRLDKIEEVTKGVDTEWSEWFDKFRRLYARIAKRQERDEAAESGTESRQDAPRRTITEPAGPNGGPFPTSRRNY